MQLTYQYRLYPHEFQSEINRAMENASRFYRTCFNHMWFGKILDFKKKSFCSQFGIGTKQANSLIILAKSQVKMWQESLCYAEKVKQVKLERLKQREQTLQQRLLLAKFMIREKSITFTKKIKGMLWSSHRKQEKIVSWLKKRKSITFGSKQSQKQLSNGKISLSEWRLKRNNFIYGIGESDASCGNNTIKLQEDHVQIEVENLQKIQIPFSAKNLLEYDKKTIRIIKKRIRKQIKYYIQITVEPNPKRSENTKIGGIDFNKGFLSFYNSDIWQNYEYTDKESLRKQIKLILSEVGTIRIEDLNFKNTKAKTLSGTTLKGKVYNAMINQLPYKMYRDLIEVEAFKVGVKVEYVNPRNTSKKALELGLDRHLGAAKIIAEGGV